MACTTAGSQTVFWIGLDGASSNTVEQAGTLAWCPNVDQPPVYFAWWEMYPTNNIQLSSININAGDTINASVSYSGGQYTLGVSDITNSQSFSQVATCTAVGGCQNGSAEWIVERIASSPTEYYPLADWGTVNFESDKASANGGSLEPINYWPNDKINMVDSSGNTLVIPR